MEVQNGWEATTQIFLETIIIYDELSRASRAMVIKVYKLKLILILMSCSLLVMASELLDELAHEGKRLD